ncbi:acetyltransferase [Lichenibacterium ramalinae]|uniref:acetyltransferase n=1 Tax=Lichenibacterium ramalinae TaxID=2316527 RepID=UPI0013EAE1DF|nr:acetyltransferase [Lichenibacterium ramalinae]
MNKHRLLVWGGSGHAKMLRPTFAAAGLDVVALVERDPALAPLFSSAVRFFGWDDLAPWLAAGNALELSFILAIGGHNGSVRCELADRLTSWGLKPFEAIHERAWVASTATMGEGCHVLPMAAVGEDAKLGRQCIVNTNASVDHECILDEGVHIMPGATLAGCVRVGAHATVGANATVLPHVNIGRGAIVGAGAVVVHDVPAGSVVVGVPARAKH